jgi:hypothetical protein
MRLYHRTFRAREILSNGFRDGEDTYMTNTTRRGVWFSDSPLDENEGAHGDTVLEIECPDELAAKQEWEQPSLSYREFLISAKVANELGRPKVVDHEFAGMSEKEILVHAEWAKQPEDLNRIRESISFLREYGLLADDAE